MNFYDNDFQIVLAVAVVVGLLLIVTLISRRIFGNRSVVGMNDAMVQILATGSLGSDKTISLVAVAGELILIGATSTHLVSLGQIRNREQGGRLPEHASARAVASSNEAVPNVSRAGLLERWIAGHA